MLALQFHVEMTEYMVKEWANLYRKELATPSTSVQSYESMISDLGTRINKMNKIADKIYERWLY